MTIPEAQTRVCKLMNYMYIILALIIIDKYEEERSTDEICRIKLQMNRPSEVIKC